MSINTYIQSYVHSKNNKIVLNGESISFDKMLSDTDFFKALYQHLQLDYPKFFKMDELCKLAFLGTEFLLKDAPLKNVAENETAVILSNASSTIETDRKHQRSIQLEGDYFPSPAIFVYTLPNITIGEISIRHRLKGENTFFVSRQYDIPFMSQYVQSILTTNKAQKVLSGWVEYQVNGYEVFMYLVGKEKIGLSIEHKKENIDNLYKTGLSV